MASTSTLSVENVHKLDQQGRPVIKIEGPEDAVEIGIDNIFNPSDEEKDLDDETMEGYNETNIDVGELIIPKEEVVESEGDVDFNTTDNLQTSGERLVLNFSEPQSDIPESEVVEKPEYPKDINRDHIYKTHTSTYCKEDLKKAIATKAPKSVKTIHPHEFTRLNRNKYVCNHCQSTCKRKKDLEKHIRYKHRDVTNMYQCPYCPYKSKWHMKRHILSKHKEKDIHWCNVLKLDQPGRPVIKIEGAKEEDPVEIGIDDIFNPSDEEKDLDNQNNNLLTELKKVNGSKIDGDKLIVSEEEEESEDDVDFNATANLQTGERLVLNFAKSQSDNPDVPELEVVTKSENSKDINWGDIYRTLPSTDCGEDLKKVIVTMAPKSVLTVHPHEFTMLSRNEYVCNHCQSTCKRKKLMDRHIRQSHRDVTTVYQCPYCPYKSKWDLKQHILLKHKKKSDIHWFNCGLCDKKFKLKAHLNKHIIRLHLSVAQFADNMKRCRICPKMFKTVYRLGEHVKFVHNNEPRRRFQCPFCEFNSGYLRAIQRHKEVHHPVSHQRKTYKCEDCDYKTKFLFQLKKHRTIHKKAFCCEKCAYVTTTSHSVLKLHQVTHQATIDKHTLRFRCDLCDYKTYRAYSLKVHKLNHLKPDEIEYFYCYHCDFKAKRKDNLKTHVLRHFKKEEVDLQCFKRDFTTKKRTLLTEHLQQNHPL